MRIDKYIGNLGYGSRKQIAKYIKDGLIQLNNNPVFTADEKVEYGDKISIGEEEIEVLENIYVMINKPANYISSDKDEASYTTYKALLRDCPYVNLLSLAGRLDTDTEGLLVVSSDGDFIHKLISPKKDIYKKYYVEIESSLSALDKEKLEKGVKINVGKPIIDDIITLPAKLEIIDDKKIYLRIKEGKFHQVKKMLESVKNKVIYLKRVSMGEIDLGDLDSGAWRYLNEEEIKSVLK